MNGNLFSSFGDDQEEEVLPNGYTRGEYHKQGFSDYDIEFWNLGQYGATSPQAAGWILMELMDGDLGGDIEF